MPDIVGQEIKFIRLNEHDLIGRIMERGFFEGHVLTTACKLLEGAMPGVILDIGANMGTFTVPLAYGNPQFYFVAFEPQRMVYNQLCGNLAINMISNVEAHNFGLSKTQQEIDVEVPDYMTETNIGAFSLDAEVRSHDDYLCKTKGNVQKIMLYPLDSLGIKDIRLIKIDVEGMELDVLMGGIETIKRNNYPPILFEAWEHKDWFAPRKRELCDFLESLGYEITNMGEDNYAIYKGEK
mgnify:CR=1 FL=1